MGVVVVVECDVEGGEVGFVVGVDVVDVGFWCQVGFFCCQYDWCVVCVVGVDVDYFVVGYVLCLYLDVGLDVVQQVVYVQGIVGVGQGVGDEEVMVYGSLFGLSDCVLWYGCLNCFGFVCCVWFMKKFVGGWVFG